MLTRADLEMLMRHHDRPSVTITLTTDLPSLAVRQDSIHLDNLVQQAERQLLAQGWDRNAVAPVLEPARRLVGNDPFWAGGRRGMALFLAPGFERIYEFDRDIESVVACGDRFRITPVLPLVAEDGGDLFFLLTVTADQAQLFGGDSRGLRVIAADLPQGVASVAQQTDYQQTTHSNPSSGVRGGRGSLARGGDASAVPADQNFGASPEDLRKAELLQYLNKLAGAVKGRIGHVPAPLVLAAQPEVAGNFRKQSEIPNLWPDHVDTNPSAMSASDLHRRAWELVREHVERDVPDAINHFNSLYNDGSQRASTEPAELVKAARWGRMDTLLLAEGRHVWGRFDEDADRVETHREPAPADDDLLDLAAQQTLLNGGQVRMLPPDAMPAGAQAAGILRY